MPMEQALCPQCNVSEITAHPNVRADNPRLLLVEQTTELLLVLRVPWIWKNDQVKMTYRRRRGE